VNEATLIINKNPTECRVAVVEDGVLLSIQIERTREKSMVGNVYKGKVSRVLPGMQSAFVEIGAERTAFLFGGDVVDPAFIERKKKELEFDELTLTQSEEGDAIPRTPIEQLLREGQDIVVQVTKDPIGTKGARLTTFIALPGRYVVLLPDFAHIGVSRRISAEVDRERIKSLIAELKPDEFGVIARTASLDVAADDIQKDLRYLVKVWHSVKSKIRDHSSPKLVYEEPAMHVRATREMYGENIAKIIVDDREVYQDVDRFLQLNIPAAATKLEIYEEKIPLFDRYELEVDIGRGLGRKVWLPSGGYLVIDQTEALTTFDVNTGKFVGKMSARETIFKTNLEAATAIAAQLRLRNIGGIMVLDFIDMDEPEDRLEVSKCLEDALEPDRAKTTVLAISEMGLVQMTRKRTSESLQQKLMDSCPMCFGRGHIKSSVTEAHELIRDVERYAVQTNSKFIRIKARPDIKRLLERDEKSLISYVVKKHKIKLSIEDFGVNLKDLKEPSYEVVPSSDTQKAE
jgi:ribonuclease G